MKTKTKIKIAVAGGSALLFIVFMILNTELVELNLIIAKVTMPRSLMLIGVFGAGFLVGWITNSFVRTKPKKVEA